MTLGPQKCNRSGIASVTRPELTQAEVRVMLRCMLEVQNQTAPPEHPKKPPDHDSIDKLESQVFSFCGSSTGEDSQKRVTVEEYLCWTVSHPELPGEFSRLIYQLCHVVIGLRPTNRSEEGSIVRGWLEREERNEWVSGRSAHWHSFNMSHNSPIYDECQTQ